MATHSAIVSNPTTMTNASANTSLDTTPLLLQPIHYGGREETDQYIGGNTPSWAPLCASCGSSIRSLARFRTVDQKRRLDVVACTKASCWNDLFKEKGNISLGGKGVVVCRVSAVEEDPIEEEESKTKTAFTNNKRTTDREEWGDLDSQNMPIDMESLEAQLIAIEGGLSRATNAKQDRKEQTNDGQQVESSNDAINTDTFPRYELYSIKEPNAPRSNTNANNNSKDNAKIQAMLERYLAEETDEEIQNALRITNQGAETYIDEVPTADRILYDYKERLQRAPRQVIRCGGTPIWSAYVWIILASFCQLTMVSRAASSSPIILPRELMRNRDDEETNDQDLEDEPPLHLPARLIPPCNITGKARIFEAQLLPTLLHSLRVDKTQGALDVQFSKGAMDFGNIMIYTSESSKEAICVVQKSVDEAPTEQRKFKLVNLPNESGSAILDDDQASTFTDGSVDDDFTIGDGEDDGDELW